MYGECLRTSELQFGFKPGLSTAMCTGVLKAVVSQSLDGGSKVYGCLVDASKAFDTVDHSILLESYCLEVYLMHWCAFSSDGTRPSVYEPNGMVSPQMLSVSLRVFVRVEFFHLPCSLFTWTICSRSCHIPMWVATGRILCWCSCIH